MKKTTPYLFLLLYILFPYSLTARHEPTFSTAGFFQLEGTGREVFSMNPAWRFYKGDVNGAEKKDFDDSDWSVISLPHGIEYLPTEASGCINYQGPVWYRKHFTPATELKDKRLFLHFEAIMGKSKIYLNGKLLTSHYGGFLPVITDITDDLIWDEENIIAILADNSNDPMYPPGKNQEVLDFSYFGGIYRDCWLITHNNVYITDPNYEDKKAGGGLFVAYDNVSDNAAKILLNTHLRNSQLKPFAGTLEFELYTPDGKRIKKASQKIELVPEGENNFTTNLALKQPLLWSPSAPNLYNLEVRVR